MSLRGATNATLPTPPALRDPELLLPNLLPILKRGGDPNYGPLMNAYLALPGRDWITYANRAAVLSEIGDFDAALKVNATALQMAPNEPAALNNACYIAYEAGRPAEGLPYCVRAVALAPTEAAVRDSYASVLAATGKCTEATAQYAEARRLDPTMAATQKPVACKAR